MSSCTASRPRLSLARRFLMWLDHRMTDKPPDVAAPSTSFGFISEDVSKQIAASRSILDVADRLRERLATVTDEAEKTALADEICRLVKIANELNANAMYTATTSSSVLSNVAITILKP